MNRFGHSRADWMGSVFFGMLIVYLISWSLMLYPPWRIGGAFNYGSWQHVAWALTESKALGCAWIFSSLSMIGFAVAFSARPRPVLATIAIVAASLGLIALLTLPAVN